MYMTDRRLMEFIDGMHEFIKLLRNTSTMVSFVVHAKNTRMRRITHHQEPSTVTCSVVVSCQTTMFGPSMEKRGIMLDNNNEEEEDRITDFAGNYGAFFDDTAMGEPEGDAEGHDVEDDLVRCCVKLRKFAKHKRNREI